MVDKTACRNMCRSNFLGRSRCLAKVRVYQLVLTRLLLLVLTVYSGFAAAIETSGITLESAKESSNNSQRNNSRSYSNNSASSAQAESLYNYGIKNLNGDVAKAFRLFRKAANQGYPKANYQLGVMYRDGVGVARNKSEAIKSFRQAAAWGDKDAQMALDQLVTKKKKTSSIKPEDLPGDRNHPEELYQLAKRIIDNERDYKIAIPMLEKAAKLNHSPSQYLLGKIYKEGKGISKNVAKAKKWLSKSASNNYLKSRVLLRELLSEENKNNRSKLKSASSRYNFSADAAYLLAAKKGDVDAQYNLGSMYVEGETIEGKTSEGLRWLRRAANRGHLEAQLKLAELLFKGVDVDRDYVESAKWYLQAARQGHSGAQYSLANMHRKGLGLEKNINEAQRWYRKAAKQGHIKAKDTLASL